MLQREDSVGVQEKGKRAPNWLVGEDVILARAFVKMYRDLGDLAKARVILESIDISQANPPIVQHIPENPSLVQEEPVPLLNVPEEVILEGDDEPQDMLEL
jgi:hypothetical protein